MSAGPVRPPCLLWCLDDAVAPVEASAWGLAAGVLARPFRPGAPHADWVRDWEDPARQGPTHRALGTLLEQGADLLHVPGDGSPVFDVGLALAAARLGYRQVFALWRHPRLRLRQAARRAGWDTLAPAARRAGVARLIDSERRSRSPRLRGLAVLQARGLPHAVLALDELLADDAAARTAWQQAWGDGAALPPADGPLQQALQAAAAALDDEAEALIRDEASWCPPGDLLPAYVLPSLQRLAPATRPLAALRIDNLPVLMAEGDALQRAGVLAVTHAPEAALLLRQGRDETVMDWPCPSPQLAAQHPDEPAAAQARFKTTDFAVRARTPARLVLREPGGGEQALAELRFRPWPRPAIRGILLSHWSIGYQPIPKTACTSIKEALFRVLRSEPFRPERGCDARHVHHYFDLREQDITQAAWRFLVVRDPVQRFLSGFSNRVLHHRELSRDYVLPQAERWGLDLTGFVFDPDLDTFIDRYEQYAAIPTIHHHFRPISEFVAPLDAFDRVYAFEELDALVADLSRRLGRPVQLPHSQRGGPKLRREQLSAAARAGLRRLYADDYALLSAHYAPPA